LLGGDIDKATTYLKQAAAKTNIPEAKYPEATCSANGFVNFYCSQVLNKNGEVDEAKKLAQNFINADPKLFPAELRAENVEPLRKRRDYITAVRG
jgi:hypothetical protein